MSGSAPYFKDKLKGLIVLLAFLLNSFGSIPTVQAQDLKLPAPGQMVQLSPEYNPPIIKGLKVHPDNPFRFDFILDKGDGQLSNSELKNESSKLIKYFLASITIPENDLWVNLSPYEKDRIIPNSFGLTEMGRDLLAEDYMLKQITASLIYPEGETGKKFWKRIYEEAQKRFGTTNIPVNTFNKVWVLPEKAVVFENAKMGTAYVVESKLKVMLEEDYLSFQKHECMNSACFSPINGPTQGRPLQNDINALGSKIVREIVIPELTTEINAGKNFAKLRQVYNSLILATWYKNKIQDSILEQAYADKNKVVGVSIEDPKEKDRIYLRYLSAFKKGVYNYVQEDKIANSFDPLTGGEKIIPRKYFSGGASFNKNVMSFAMSTVTSFQLAARAQDFYLEGVNIIPALGQRKDFAQSQSDKATVSQNTITPQEIRSYLHDLRKHSSDDGIRLIKLLAAALGDPSLLDKQGVKPSAREIEDILVNLEKKGGLSLDDIKKIALPSGRERSYSSLLKYLFVLGGQGPAAVSSNGAVNNHALTDIDQKTLLEAELRGREQKRDNIQQDKVSNVLMFGDKHGDIEDLEKVEEEVMEFVKENKGKLRKKLTVIGHGDGFDRGKKNVDVFNIMKRLKKIEAENPGLIEVRFLWGNHDVWLMRAILLNDKDVRARWLGVGRGGSPTLRNFQEKGVDIKELALFMLENFELFHVDEWGMMHVHAGIPIDDSGKPGISRKRLDDLARQLNEFQVNLKADPGAFLNDNKQKIENFFAMKDVKQLFSIREEKWLDKLQTGTGYQVKIDESNKSKIIDLTKRMYQESGVSVSAPEMKMVEKEWATILLRNPDVFRASGVDFEIVPQQPGKTNIEKLNLFLRELGVNGIFFGHIHHGINIANKIIGIDVDEQDPGHYLLSEKGLQFISPRRSNVKPEFPLSEVLGHLGFEINRIREKLGSPKEVVQVYHVDLVGAETADQLTAQQLSEPSTLDFPKWKMRKMGYAAAVTWRRGEFGAKMGLLTNGDDVELYDIRIRGAFLSGVVTRVDGGERRTRGLLVKKGDCVEMRRSDNGEYLFVAGKNVYKVGVDPKFPLDQSLIQTEGVDLREYKITRTFNNGFNNVSVVIAPGANTSTRIKPVLGVILSEEEAVKRFADTVVTTDIDLHEVGEGQDATGSIVSEEVNLPISVIGAFREFDDLELRVMLAIVQSIDAIKDHNKAKVDRDNRSLEYKTLESRDRPSLSLDNVRMVKRYTEYREAYDLEQKRGVTAISADLLEKASDFKKGRASLIASLSNANLLNSEYFTNSSSSPMITLKSERARIALETIKNDLGMISQVGGIDLALTKSILQNKNVGGIIKFHLNPAMLAQLLKAPGFDPAIISIEPLGNLQKFLGLNQI